MISKFLRSKVHEIYEMLLEVICTTTMYLYVNVRTDVHDAFSKTTTRREKVVEFAC